MEAKTSEPSANASELKASDVKPSSSKSSRPKVSGGKVVQKHKSLLASYLNLKVMLVTFDGRTLVGTMRGSDQVCNVILENTTERIFSAGMKPKEVQLGLFVVRGDNVAVVGEVDAEKEGATDWDNMKVGAELRFLRSPDRLRALSNRKMRAVINSYFAFLNRYLRLNRLYTNSRAVHERCTTFNPMCQVPSRRDIIYSNPRLTCKYSDILLLSIHCSLYTPVQLHISLQKRISSPVPVPASIHQLLSVNIVAFHAIRCSILSSRETLVTAQTHSPPFSSVSRRRSCSTKSTDFNTHHETLFAETSPARTKQFSLRPPYTAIQYDLSSSGLFPAFTVRQPFASDQRISTNSILAHLTPGPEPGDSGKTKPFPLFLRTIPSGCGRSSHPRGIRSIRQSPRRLIPVNGNPRAHSHARGPNRCPDS